jgi:DNA-binding transcriptional LysR family regulator
MHRYFSFPALPGRCRLFLFLSGRDHESLDTVEPIITRQKTCPIPFSNSYYKENPIAFFFKRSILVYIHWHLLRLPLKKEFSMTLHQLRIFSAVAKHLNISKAAVALHISQPSVSEQLKLLQEECGVKLYKSTGRGIELAREGRLFLKEAEFTLLQVERLKGIFSPNLRESEARFLTVGGTLGPSARFLPGIASIFRRTHPHVQLNLRTDSSPVMEQLVQNSEVEIAVITTPSASTRLVYEPCRKEELVLFVSSGHPLSNRKQLRLAELAQIPLVVLKKGQREAGGAVKILHQIDERFYPTVVMCCETAEAIKFAVTTTKGLGILHRDLVEPDIHRGNLRIIHMPGLKTHTESYIIYSKEKPLSADAKDFLALLHQWPTGTKGAKAFLRRAA